MNTSSLITAILICGLFPLTPFAQESKSGAKEPKTKLEAFEAQTGTVLIKGIGEIGSITGTGSIEVDCREFTDAGTTQKRYGITVEVAESGRFARPVTSFVDYDEIDSLLKGIDYISKIDNSVTSLSNFEAVYKTKGELRVTTFSSKKGEKIRAAVQTGSIVSATSFLSLDQLAKFRGMIAEAKSKLDSIKKDK